MAELDPKIWDIPGIWQDRNLSLAADEQAKELNAIIRALTQYLGERPSREQAQAMWDAREAMPASQRMTRDQLVDLGPDVAQFIGNTIDADPQEAVEAVDPSGTGIFADAAVWGDSDVGLSAGEEKRLANHIIRGLRRYIGQNPTQSQVEQAIDAYLALDPGDRPDAQEIVKNRDPVDPLFSSVPEIASLREEYETQQAIEAGLLEEPDQDEPQFQQPQYDPVGAPADFVGPQDNQRNVDGMSLKEFGAMLRWLDPDQKESALDRAMITDAAGRLRPLQVPIEFAEATGLHRLATGELSQFGAAALYSQEDQEAVNDLRDPLTGSFIPQEVIEGRTNIVNVVPGMNYRDGDQYRYFTAKSDRYVRQIQAKLLQAGLLLQEDIREWGYWGMPEQTKMQQLMVEADQRMATWEQVLESYVENPLTDTFSNGRAGSSTQAAFTEPVQMAPDWATLKQTVKGVFRNQLGRDPRGAELQEFIHELDKDYASAHQVDVDASRTQWYSNQEANDPGVDSDSLLQPWQVAEIGEGNYLPRDDTAHQAQVEKWESMVPDATRENLENQGSSGGGTFRAVDPFARFKEQFEQKYGPEMDRNERRALAQQRSAVMRSSLGGLTGSVGGYRG